MSLDIIKEYIKRYIALHEDRAASRGARSKDALLVVDKLNRYYKEEGKFFEISGMASQGSQSTDLELRMVSLGEERTKEEQKVWSFEVKSFDRDDEFKVEITNPRSLIRKIVLQHEATLGTEKDIEEQLRKKISSDPKAVSWAEQALQSSKSSTWSGKIVIPGDKEPRILKVTSGDIGDWSRLKAAGGSGQFRSFYTVSNPMLRAAEKEMYYTDELEEAIQNEFRKKGDEVLILFGKSSDSIRCFSLTPEAETVFGYPMFSSGGDTLIPESAKVTSFGGAGRIGVIVRVLDESGFKVG